MAHALDGPDFLRCIADAERAGGNLINADAYERRAADWKADQKALQQSQQRIADLEYRLAQIQVHAKAA
jgi:hypothetical protein